MDRSQLEDAANAFLSAYENKDLETIASQLALDVVVRDWNLEVFGKERALEEFRKNFEAANSLSISVLKLHSSENAVAAELEIVVNDAELLRVVDVLTFNSMQEISSIISYKGL